MLSKEATITQLQYTIQALSLEAEEQLASFPDFVITTDELLLEFDHWQNVAVSNFPEYFSTEQLKVLNDINILTNKYEVEDLNMTISEELKTSPFWKALRALANEALVKFNWTFGIPPYNRVTYIKG